MAGGKEDDIVSKLGDLAVSALRKPRRETLMTLLPEVAASRPLRKGEEYVRVRMLAARLPDAGNLLSSKLPLVYAGVGLGEISNDPAGFAKAISSGFNTEGLKGDSRETLGEVVLFNASPYAGQLNLALGLLSVRNSARAKELLKKVAELSEKAATPFIGEAAKTIGAVANAVDLLTADGNYFELGLMKSVDAPATGVYALYSDLGKADEGLVFGFANGKLINNATKAPLRRSYVVIAIEALETRDDAHMIPRLRKKFDSVIEEIEKGADEERVKALIQEYAGLAALWPDLLKADQDNLVKSARERFKSFREARAGFEGMGEGAPERPTLDAVMADALKARFKGDEAAAAVASVTTGGLEGKAELLSLEEIADRLPKAVDAGDLLAVSTYTTAAVADIQIGSPPFAHMPIKRIMHCLRAARRFNEMKLIGEKLMAQGERQPLFMKLHGQALIELGETASAELMLKQAEDLAKHRRDPELSDIYGSLGRVHKERFVGIDFQSTRARQLAFDTSLKFYRLGRKHSNDPANLYHDVNVMALAVAGQRAGLSVPKDLSPKHIAKLAERIRGDIDRKDPNIPDWDYSNAAEAALALGDHAEARRRLDEYARANIRNPFALHAALRQIQTIWGITVGSKHGDIVDGLQMALMGADNGATLSQQGVEHLLNASDKARFEAIFDGETGISVQTAYKALGMSAFVGMVRHGDKPKGTGFLVRTRDLVQNDALIQRHDIGEWLFLTNAHVISPTGEHGAIPGEGAQIEFQMAGAGQRFKALRTLWWSPATSGHDCTILELDGHPQFPANVAPASISSYLPKCHFEPGERATRPRVLVLGHPDGRPLEITFNNNLMLDHDGPAVGQSFSAKPVHVQYRAPTEPGSSGSPVFDADTLELLAIHHRGAVQPLDAKFGDAARYQANQGMSLRAIMEAFQVALGGASASSSPRPAPAAVVSPPPVTASAAAGAKNEAAFESLRGYADYEEGPAFESIERKSDRKLPRQCGDFIAGFEISSGAYYRKFLQSPVWPGAESGLTIGVGYDLRHASASEFREHWSPHLSTEVIERLVAYCGVGEPDLGKRKLAVATLKDITISLEAAFAVFTDIMMPTYTFRTENCFDNTLELHDFSMGALVSLVFNRGDSLSSKDSRLEMRSIAMHMKARAFDKIADEIRAMKRLWENDAKVAGLLDRRDKEADMFAEGLRLQALTAVA